MSKLSNYSFVLSFCCNGTTQQSKYLVAEQQEKINSILCGLQCKREWIFMWKWNKSKCTFATLVGKFRSFNPMDRKCLTESKVREREREWETWRCMRKAQEAASTDGSERMDVRIRRVDGSSRAVSVQNKCSAWFVSHSCQQVVDTKVLSERERGVVWSDDDRLPWIGYLFLNSRFTFSVRF